MATLGLRFAAALSFALALGACTTTAPPADQPTPSLGDLLKQSSPGEWREPDPENTVYMDLPGGRVVFELAPAFAPLHAGNIRTLVREKYFGAGPFPASTLVEVKALVIDDLLIEVEAVAAPRR